MANWIQMLCVMHVSSFCSFCFSAKPEGEGKSAALQHLPTDLSCAFTLSHSDLIIALTFSLFTHKSHQPPVSNRLWLLRVVALARTVYMYELYFVYFVSVPIFYSCMPACYCMSSLFLPSGISTENMLSSTLSDYWHCLFNCLQIMQ